MSVLDLFGPIAGVTNPIRQSLLWQIEWVSHYFSPENLHDLDGTLAVKLPIDEVPPPPHEMTLCTGVYGKLPILSPGQLHLPPPHLGMSDGYTLCDRFLGFCEILAHNYAPGAAAPETAAQSMNNLG